jgi:AraC family transcriptional regulator, transcriptional activator of pobA
MFDKERQLISPVPLPHPKKLLMIEPLDYSNPYDFHRMHRHDYFEIILVREGQGDQRIDFASYEMNKGEIYTIYPGQIHLMERKSANGLLIQFRKEIFEFTYPLKHYHLYFNSPAIVPGMEVFDHLFDIATRMQQALKAENLSAIAVHKVYNYLQILLISLIDYCNNHVDNHNHNMISQFLSLLTNNIYSKKKVSEYCAMLGCDAEKLNKVCKDGLGKNALEIIHEEIMLEIRRLMLFGNLSLKEIAYEMNFDTQQNFSAFVKAKTGMAPSGLFQSIREIN